MIVRVYRSRVQPGMHTNYDQWLQETAIPALSSAPGLVSLHVGTPLEDPPQEFLLMSIWQDLAAIRAAFGHRWRDSFVLPGEEHLVAEAIVDHYECQAEIRPDS